MPLVFTFTMLVSLILALGGAATTPVFLACATSYTVVAGRGVVHRIILGSKPKEAMADQRDANSNRSADQALHEESQGETDNQEAINENEVRAETKETPPADV